MPGLPDCVLKLRSAVVWRAVEGLLGPERFTNINAQARLAELNVSVRSWWASGSTGAPKVAVAFGEDDPLLRDFKDVLDETISPHLRAGSTKGTWISGAGHYPVEERPEFVAELCRDFLMKSG